ncbi:hypothetical protein HVA01_32790 [Halovibrio variabilis]|uniref:Peptidase M1 membrane alanine aminopeptidase domain-containing protein n=1 Tax=Halovibrio variabilis TaxID=31910 RepID=A0A511UW13_9GAMM|nr:M1 family aminopeptidase [Halovibrio variabilis]GEN29633.1 hypothetical protein HVA01_32790 [Halovibrio variabilis]
MSRYRYAYRLLPLELCHGCRLCGLLGLLLLGLLTAGFAWGESTDSSSRTLIIQLDPTTRAIQGELRQHLSADASFHLLKGLTVTSAQRGDEALAITQDAEGRWHLAAGDDAAGSDLPVTLHWRGTLPDTGQRHRIDVAGTFLPTRSGWYPQLGDTAGPLSLSVEVPDGQLAVGSGSLIEEQYDKGNRYLARFYHPRTREVAIAAGPWQLRERTVEGVQLRTLFPEKLDKAFAETYLQRAAEQLARFQARLGPLPYTSFSIAASPAPVGLAFPGFTLLGERVIPLPFIPHTSLPHELMHAWWGAGVGVDYPSGNWAEALTTYLADHDLAEQQGEAEAMRRRWLADLAALPASQESALVAFRGDADPAGRLIGYQHGAMLFHMLRQRIGDAAFDLGLRSIANEWMHHNADWQVLIDAFSQATGETQDAFFTPWLTRPGRPSLHLESVQVKRQESGYRLSGILVQRGQHAPWPLNVPLVVDTDAGQINHRQPMDGLRQPFELSMTARPRALEVDPAADLLRHPGSTPPILRQLTLDPTTRVLALDEAHRALAQRVLGREAEAITPFDALRDEGPPLLVIGTTDTLLEWRQANHLPAPPEPLETAEAARFWMLPGQPIGLLSGNDTDALAQLAATLRHHGQQSYVVQDGGGQTVRVGVWPMKKKPLRVSFTANDFSSQPSTSQPPVSQPSTP